MDNTTRNTIILCVVLVAIVGYIYYDFDIIREKKEYTNISISADHNGKKIKTGYVIQMEEDVIQGNTSQSYERLVIEKNQIIEVKNVNILGQNFYIENKIINITKDTHRIDIVLEEPKEIKVDIIKKDPILLNITSSKLNNLDFCVSWSTNYIFVKAKDFEETYGLENYKNWDKCYKGNFGSESENNTIKIDYSKFGTPGKNDYIKVILFEGTEGVNNTKELKIL